MVFPRAIQLLLMCVGFLPLITKAVSFPTMIDSLAANINESTCIENFVELSGVSLKVKKEIFSYLEKSQQKYLQMPNATVKGTHLILQIKQMSSNLDLRDIKKGILVMDGKSINLGRSFDDVVENIKKIQSSNRKKSALLDLILPEAQALPFLFIAGVVVGAVGYGAFDKWGRTEVTQNTSPQDRVDQVISGFGNCDMGPLDCSSGRLNEYSFVCNREGNPDYILMRMTYSTPNEKLQSITYSKGVSYDYAKRDPHFSVGYKIGNDGNTITGCTSWGGALTGCTPGGGEKSYHPVAKDIAKEFGSNFMNAMNCCADSASGGCKELLEKRILQINTGKANNSSGATSR